MKSIKTHPNSAKGPDKGKIVNKLYCILLITLELSWLYFFSKKTDIKFIILISNLKEISPSVFSWKKKRIYKKLWCNSTVKIRFGWKKILNYAYVLKNGVGRYNIFFNFYTKLDDSSFLCRCRVESVNVLVCAMYFFFNKQFRTCTNALPNEVTV